MIEWLHHQSDVTVFAILTVPFVVAVLGASVVAHRLLPSLYNDDSGFEIMDAFVAVASVAGIILAFTLVEVDAHLATIEENIAREAESVEALDRSILGFGDANAPATHGLLLRYASKIAQEEWPRMAADGVGSADVDELCERIDKAVRSENPTTPRETEEFGEALKVLDQMKMLREQRLEAAAVSLPSLFWKSLIVLFVLMVAIASQTEPTRKRLVGMATIATTLGVLLAITVILDAPFAGEAAVTPHEFERIIEVMNHHGAAAGIPSAERQPRIGAGAG